MLALCSGKRCLPYREYMLSFLNGLQKITSVQDRYQHKTQVAWNPWRPIVIAVLFGLLMLFAVIAGCTVVTGRFPRTAATFTWLLWIMTAIFMILGAGKFLSSACWSGHCSSCSLEHHVLLKLCKVKYVRCYVTWVLTMACTWSL